MAAELRPGDRFSGCEIIALCGRGAFGVIWLAADPLGRRVIIKIVESPLCSERELAGLRNYMAVAGKHPALLRIHHIGENSGRIFYIMEAADNCGDASHYLPATLDNLIKLGERISPERAVGILRELLGALQVMHSAGLVHRDIKPSNIIFVNGSAKLSDPGLVAAIDTTVTFAGTLGFFPPEILEHPDKPNVGNDLYALGKVFYCMVTGLPPGRYPELPADMRSEVCRQLFPVLNRMCNRNPVKRFRSAEEFLAALPETIAPPTRFERFREEFRAWRALNFDLYRRIRLAAVFALVLLLAAVGGFAFHRIRENRAVARARAAAETFAELNRERPELVALQLEAFCPAQLPAYRKLRGEFDSARSRGEWRRAAALGGELRRLLREAAAALLPELPADSGDFARGCEAVGRVHSFLAAPLAVYLDGSARNELRKKLADFETKLYRNWGGLRFGEGWDNEQEYYLPLVFVPAGAVRLEKGGELVRIPRPFWLCRKEVEHEFFTFMMAISPQVSTVPRTPATRIVWNDLLFFCRMLTLQNRAKGLLPPGYIIRPPTEAEWEYAAKNGWLGADETPFAEREVSAENSGGAPRLCASLAPNRLGLYDMLGNVREFVIPHHPLPTTNYVVARGGSYRTAPANALGRLNYLKYQYLIPDVGIRLAVAPGELDFFDRNFFLHDGPQCRVGGKVYELLGGNLSASWKKLEQLCRLLGGNLAEFEDPARFTEMRKHLLSVGAWETAVGARRVGGEWRWIRSGKKVGWGKWEMLRGKESGDELCFRQGKWCPARQESVPIGICEWEEARYEDRNRHLTSDEKLPFELLRFTVGDRRFVLFGGSPFVYTADRVCSLLGGRLACLDTPEVRARVTAELKPYRGQHILLGGYAKWDEWYWMSGKKIDFPLRKAEKHLIPTRNRNFVTLRDGEFYDSQFAGLFLCEWSASSLSPRSR